LQATLDERFIVKVKLLPPGPELKMASFLKQYMLSELHRHLLHHCID
jgi:hypothetical protein